ncbi:hypothetical protein DC498_02395 [Terrimonas sp.]|uniref:hypothetical protein n=1 Tax=Terrimonas sp. TaxID=1914338 RepID=UPI000D515658|nr:hypothetical protein [Terrimonas sp.]PVD54250.1 hypothetical protein DC498_02395 [Terrimonas sp.]
MNQYHLDITITKLKGPTEAQIITCNQWAATGLDKFHVNSEAEIEFEIDGATTTAKLLWDSNFSKAAMKEEKDMANHGGVALAWFAMSVLLDYGYVEQTEIGDGVDYRFMKQEPNDDDLNFMDNFHHVEISGILQEYKTNTLKGRIKDKHEQIDRGGKRNESSSVIVTLFSQPKTVKEIHK